MPPFANHTNRVAGLPALRQLLTHKLGAERFQLHHARSRDTRRLGWFGLQHTALLMTWC